MYFLFEFLILTRFGVGNENVDILSTWRGEREIILTASLSNTTKNTIACTPRHVLKIPSHIQTIRYLRRKMTLKNCT